MPTDEPSITTLGAKGQVVIPQKLRTQLGVGPKTKFLVFGQGDTIVLKRLELPDVGEAWDKVFRMAARSGMSQAQVDKEVQAKRKAHR